MSTRATNGYHAPKTGYTKEPAIDTPYATWEEKADRSKCWANKCHKLLLLVKDRERHRGKLPVTCYSVPCLALSPSSHSYVPTSFRPDHHKVLRRLVVEWTTILGLILICKWIKFASFDCSRIKSCHQWMCVMTCSYLEGFVRNPPVSRSVARLSRVGETWLPLFKLFARNVRPVCDSGSDWLKLLGWLAARNAA